MAINMPHQKAQKESALDTVAKALGVANNVLGIKSHFDEASREEDKQALLRQHYADTQLAAKQKRDDELAKQAEDKKDKVKQVDILNHIKSGGKINLVPPGTPGALTSTDSTGKEFSFVAMAPPKEKTRDELEIAKGKQLPPDKVLLVNQGNQMPKLLNNLRSTVQNNAPVFGPFAGRAGGLNPYNQSAQAIRSQMQTSAQLVGKFMEDGVLRKEDEAKYEKMLPNINDTPETAMDKLSIVENMLAEKQASNIEALKLSGYDIQGVNQGINVPALPNILSGKKESQEGVAIAGQFENKFNAEDLEAARAVEIRLKKDPKDPKALEAIPYLRQRGIKINGL